MTMCILVRRLRSSHLPPSLTQPPCPSSIHHIPLLFSSSATQPPFATQYLIQSCRLPPDKALRASKHIPHLKSPDKPDAVLRFLRHTGISQSHITTALARDPRILCSHLEKNWRPNVAKLQEVGFSIQHISGIISRSPDLFRFNFVPKIDFWIGALGSVENLSVVLNRSGPLLHGNLDKLVLPNLSFLREQCGLSVPQIVRLIKSAPRAIASSHEALKIKAERAEELGFRRSSPMFVYALITVCCLNQKTIDARLSNLTSLGLSQQEVITIVSKVPFVLNQRQEVMSCKIMFLKKEVGCDNLCLVCHPALPTYSLEKRLIPRNLVRKVLLSKGLPVANKNFYSFVVPTEKGFVEKFVLPHEVAIPGLHRAYVDACAGNIDGLNWFDRSLQV